MKQSIKYFFAIIITAFIASCSTHHILIKENGTAHVEISILDENTDESTEEIAPDSLNYSMEDYAALDELLNEFYATEIISNYQYSTIDERVGKIIFDISSVDSLGAYVDPLLGNYFEFRLTADKLIIIGSDGNAELEDDVSGMTNLLAVNATIVFEKEIAEIITANDYVKKIDNNTIEIKTSIGEMNYNGVGNRIEIIFK